MQGLIITFFMLFFASFCSCNARLLDVVSSKTIFNVMEYGAVGDGVTDDSQAFLKAWNGACGKSDSVGTIEVPFGKTFLLKPLLFNGPCKFSKVYFKVKITEAWTTSEDKTRWIEFIKVNGLVMNGSGQIDGQGSIWWKICKALSFKNCTNLSLSGIHHINSAKGHISINKCVQIRIRNLTITAPENSPNTDGIDISESNDIVVQNCTIATGDDCIAMNEGTSNINITTVNCGPGHGISIGSLGKNGNFATVKDVYVNNCSFFGTTNGLRIKTFPNGNGYVKNITYNQIRFYNTRNPIIIDEKYKDIEQVKGFEIIGLRYNDVSGSSATSVAIDLGCDSGEGCIDVIMDKVNLTSVSPNDKVTASCNKVKGQETSVSPDVSCLTKKLSLY
ncbi:hypothetical protein Lal_00036561 [Lupinus albus]|nr:hypothetical protein Lal_00036561 [Lupinus albus]